MDLSKAIIPEHAVQQMARRQISEADLRQVLAAPEKILPDRTGRMVAQAMIREYLLRVFVDVDRTPPEVVTVYRTSQVKKYRVLP